MKKLIIFFSLCVGALNPSFAQTPPPAESCESYPYGAGMTDIQDAQGGTKILSTGGASVSMDDVDSIMDAREEATMSAKAMIAKFLNEDIHSDSKVDKIVVESKQSDGKTKNVNRSELITRVKSLRNSASALLRGVVPLGSCYTKGREYRVTVGIKPETISSAEQTAGAINSSMQRQGTPQPGQSGQTSSAGAASGGTNSSGLPLQGMPGHINTTGIKKF